MTMDKNKVLETHVPSAGSDSAVTSAEEQRAAVFLDFLMSFLRQALHICVSGSILAQSVVGGFYRNRPQCNNLVTIKNPDIFAAGCGAPRSEPPERLEGQNGTGAARGRRSGG